MQAAKILHSTTHLYVVIFVIKLYLLSTAINQFQHKCIFVFYTFRTFEAEDAFSLEQELHGTILPKTTLMFGEYRTDTGYCTIEIICSTLNKNCYTMWGKAFVCYILVGCTIGISAFVNGSLNGVFGHIGSLGILNGQAKAWIGIRIGPALFGSYCNFFDEFGKDFSTLSILRSFTTLDVRPFTMSVTDSCAPLSRLNCKETLNVSCRG